MTVRSHDAGADAVELGALLVLLHGADAPVDTVEVTYRLWRHCARASAAFAADVEERRRRGASITLYGAGRAETGPAEYEETVRIWRAGDRARVEHHGGARDGYYAVSDGPLWWMWDERNGAHSNQDDPSVGSDIGKELQIMLNPVPLLSSLRFQPMGSSEVAGRPTISARGIPRRQDTRYGPAFELHELGTGADFYELEVDRQLGVLMAVSAIRDKLPFHRITTLAAAFDQPISDETFRFEPPAGKQIQSRWGEERVEHVTLVEAQQRAPFTVLMPDTVPANWQVRCRLIRPSERPPSPMQIGLVYHSVDGHESISLSQFPAGGSNPYRELGDGEGWETVPRGGIEMKTRPARWGQAQVELERDGTFVHLMSDNLTREQVLTIAGGLRPAPTTSSI
jgi:outer membrane lipoprotein-sorting protein